MLVLLVVYEQFPTPAPDEDVVQYHVVVAGGVAGGVATGTHPVSVVIFGQVPGV